MRRQRSLQNFTCSQSRAHLRRQVNGRPHVTQVLEGRWEGGRLRMEADGRLEQG